MVVEVSEQNDTRTTSQHEQEEEERCQRLCGGLSTSWQ